MHDKKRVAQGAATQEQEAIAEEFGIPIEQAATIDPAKVERYRKYLNSPQAKLNRFLDNLDTDRRNYEDRAFRRFRRFGWKKLASRSLKG